MQNLKKPNKQSGKAQLALLIAVALTAGAAGVWSELKAAGANAKTFEVRQVQVNGPNVSVNMSDQNGQVWASGTAWNNTGTQVSFGGLASGGAVSVNASTVSPRGDGAAAGVPGTAWNWNAWSLTPVIVDATASVAGSPQGWSSTRFNNHSMQVQDWNGDGKKEMFIISSQGTQSWGDQVSASVDVNGSPFASTSTGQGFVFRLNQHTVSKQ